MLYTTDADGNDSGNAPRFQPGPIRDITVSYTLPPWLDPITAVTDPLTDEPLLFAVEGRTVNVKFPLDLLQLIWIQ
jgi:hypothetical protein